MLLSQQTVCLAGALLLLPVVVAAQVVASIRHLLTCSRQCR
jgi:hypothetical protein